MLTRSNLYENHGEHIQNIVQGRVMDSDRRDNWKVFVSETIQKVLLSCAKKRVLFAANNFFSNKRKEER